jgi:hypothetical protein
LAKAGALTVHQQPLTKLDLTETGAGQLVLTGRDLAAGATPSLRLPEPTEDLVILRRGDLVVTQLAADPRPVAYVLTEQLPAWQARAECSPLCLQVTSKRTRRSKGIQDH